MTEDEIWDYIFKDTGDPIEADFYQAWLSDSRLFDISSITEENILEKIEELDEYYSKLPTVEFF